MKKINRLLSLLLAVVILLSVAGCKKTDPKKETQSSGTQGGYSSNTESDYNDTVNQWQEENENNEEFDNQDGTESAPTPGSDSQEGVDINRPVVDTNINTGVGADDHENNDADNTTPMSQGTVDKSKLPKSELNADDLQYFYEGKNYAYGITSAGAELIAFKDEYGDMVDVIAGAGRFAMQNAAKVDLFTMTTVSDFTPGMEDSYTSVTVLYNVHGSSPDISVTYTFKENSISVAANLNMKSDAAIASENSKFTRNFVNGYKSGECKINMDWYYPETGDQPYKVFESLTFENQISDDIILYTYLRSEGQEETRIVDGLKGDYLPLDFENSTGLSYTLYCDLAFVDTNTENRQGADYLGLFKGLNSDFAVGVAPVTPTDDHSTVFVGDEVKLNLNLTNLTDDDLTFSLRYDIRDYYGNVVDKGLFIDSTAYKYADANRTITVGGKYGMYYINIYAMTKYSTYRDLYAFALIPEHTYEYMDTAPWGINSPAAKNNGEWIDWARLLYKVGSASVRVNKSTDPFLIESQKLGITQIIAHYSSTNSEPDQIGSYTNSVMKFVEDMAPITKYLEIGNEYNLKCLSAGGPSEEEAYPIWYKNTFEPTFDKITEKYPNLIYIPTPDSACSENWLNQFVNGFTNPDTGLTEGKVWDKVKAVSTHIYGAPWMPDTYGGNNPQYGGGLWHIESGMQRMKANLERLNNGDATKTEFIITEIGYTSPPMSSTAVDYRTQADYMMRTAAICVAYSADVIQFFRANDRTGFFSGYGENGEWHFGFFFEHDYYGRIMPKPVGAAFAAMTRQLESYKKDSAYIDTNYDEGWDVGGARVMALDTVEHGVVRVAWSNYEVLPNGRKNAAGAVGERNPTLPWNNQWSEVDETIFKAVGETVKVVDIMGNATEYKANSNGEVTIPLTGSPVYIYGVK